MNHLVVFLLKGLALFPLGVLYYLADIFYFLLKNILKYRKTLVIENLQHAFPEKSESEIRQLKNEFYRYFSDVFFESIKLYHMPEDEIAKRVSFKGLEDMNLFAEKGVGVIVLAYHHQNWEWGSYIQKLSKHKLLVVYNKMRNNEAMDRFLLRSREKWGGKTVQMGRAAKVALESVKRDVPTLLGLIADQSALPDQGMWTYFLNREAAFFSGPEKIARRLNQPVFFQRVRKISRGKYEYEYTLLVEEPELAGPNEILLAYVRNMEKAIAEAPESYLWSHNRWKHKRPVGVRLIR